MEQQNLDKLFLTTIEETEQFGHELYKTLGKRHQMHDLQDIIICPIVLENFLAFISLSSKNEITNSISEFTNLSHDMTNIITLRSASKIFITDNIEFISKNLEIARKIFNIEYAYVNFKNQHCTIQNIHLWAAEKTHDKITNIFSTNQNEITSDTLLIFVNIIYLNAYWLKPFKLCTNTLIFNLSKDETINLPYLECCDFFNYGENKYLNVQIIELPLRGHEFSFILYLPEDGTDLFTLEQKLPIVCIDQLSQYKVDVKIPKFYVETTHEFNDILAQMGIVMEFPEIESREQTEKFCKVIQKCFIKIEAASSNHEIYKTNPNSELCTESAPTKTFHANRPFIFVLYKCSVDKLHKMILIGRFSGVCTCTRKVEENAFKGLTIDRNKTIDSEKNELLMMIHNLLHELTENNISVDEMIQTNINKIISKIFEQNNYQVSETDQNDNNDLIPRKCVVSLLQTFIEYFAKEAKKSSSSFKSDKSFEKNITIDKMAADNNDMEINLVAKIRLSSTGSNSAELAVLPPQNRHVKDSTTSPIISDSKLYPKQVEFLPHVEILDKATNLIDENAKSVIESIKNVFEPSKSKEKETKIKKNITEESASPKIAHIAADITEHKMSENVQETVKPILKKSHLESSSEHEQIKPILKNKISNEELDSHNVTRSENPEQELEPKRLEIVPEEDETSRTSSKEKIYKYENIF